MNKLMRLCSAALALAAALAAPTQSAAAAWPNRPVRLIVPFGAGTATDTVARYLSQKLQDRTGQPFVIDNRSGAAGIIGTEAAARAAPDGYTVLFTVNSVVTINPFIYKKLPYDPVKDFAPVAMVAAVPYVLVASKDAPWHRLKELLAAARAKPDSINYATLGVGTAPHIIMELVNAMAGTQLTHIPYKTSVMTAVLGGQVPLTLQPSTTALAPVKAGMLVALGTTSTRRLAALPDVPTIAEVLPGFAGDGWLGLEMATGTPAAVIERLNREVNAILALPETKEYFATLGIEGWPSTPQQMRATIEGDIAKWGKVIRDARIEAQ